MASLPKTSWTGSMDQLSKPAYSLLTRNRPLPFQILPSVVEKSIAGIVFVTNRIELAGRKMTRNDRKKTKP